MLICNAQVLTERGLLRGISVRTANGRIQEMGELVVREDETVIEGEGCVLSPGFIDIHIHGYGGQDTMYGRAAIEHMARGLVRHGVTGFLPTTMAAPYDETRSALSAARDVMGAEPVGARVLGCHLEGPFLNIIKKGAQPGQFIFPPSMENYLKIAEGLEDAVKLMTVAPEVEGATALIEALRSKLALSAGHTDATVDQVGRAADAGVTQVTHLFNGMNALTHRAPGVPGAALTDARIRVQIIADLLHLHPVALKLAYLSKGADGCLLITDAMEATGMPDGQYKLGANDVFVKNSEARLWDGTIAGSTLTMDRAVKNMIEHVGVPAAEALRMATRSPTDAISEAHRGRLLPGHHADMVLLDGAYEVVCTIVGGEIAYQR